MITFVVPGIAQTQGSMVSFKSKKSGAIITKADNPKTGPWRTEVAWAARIAGCPLLEGPVAVLVEIFLPRPRGHFGARGNLLPSAPAFPCKKRDADKLLRAIFDALTGVAYRDDGQVIDVTLRKRFCREDQPPEARISVGSQIPL